MDRRLYIEAAATKVSVYKSRAELFLQSEITILVVFVLICGTENFCNFTKVSYIYGCFFHIFMGKPNTKLEFVYFLVSAL